MANQLDEAVVAQQRERLFAATVELVSKRGYRETSVDQILAAAEVDDVAFHELYESKEGMFLAAFDRIVAESLDALSAAVAGVDGWPQEMATGLSCLLDLVLAEPRRARIALVEVQAAGPQAYQHFKAVIDRAVPKLEEGRRFNREAAAFSGALEEAILGGITWIVQQRLVKGELSDPDLLLEEAVRIALSPYVGDKEAEDLAVATLQDRAPRN